LHSKVELASLEVNEKLGLTSVLNDSGAWVNVVFGHSDIEAHPEGGV
jgi:hypothetical protein